MSCPPEDVEGLSFGTYAPEPKGAWTEAAREGKVYVWKEEKEPIGASIILAGYFGDPSAGSQVVALVHRFAGDREMTVRGSLRRVTEKNFAGLTVGMTLAQLQEPLGTGRRATIKDLSSMDLNETTAWASAVARDRAQIWAAEWPACILAAFTGDPSAGGKVEVLVHSSGRGYEQKPAGKWNVSEENYDKLKVGMTLQEAKVILGEGRPAIAKDLRGLGFYTLSLTEPSRIAAWARAVTESRVQIWNQGRLRQAFILAAFPGDPSGNSKVDVIFRGEHTRLSDGSVMGERGYVQKPADRWMVSKDNFLKLKVGMTLRELEDVIGVGERCRYPPTPLRNSKDGADERARKDKGWKQAVNEYRVYEWKNRFTYWVYIRAAFSEPPSAASKVEALTYRNSNDNVWDEDKGTLSDPKK